MSTVHQNRLAAESSPYLLQHATNPVDWFPWGEEAFEEAIKQKKPVFLSIGYSACHWCHVMAHESFEDSSIAQYMNSHFINIKVDREEYPDVDHLYQTFVQVTTGRGGWPLSVFLTPDKVPFYGGTYFPKQARYGMIGFPELLKRIRDIYHNEPEKIAENSTEIRSFFEKMDQSEKSDQLPNSTQSFKNLYRSLENSFDPEHGGFSKAPKFPHVADMEFLLTYYHYTGQKKAREMVLSTLEKMAQGGIYDQIGGGFARYSTDEKWLIPHFEKMLYDNALLIQIFVDAFRLTGKKHYMKIGQETADFVLRELYSPQGTFYAALDADSEGEEGKFYVWGYDEIRSHLDEDIRDLFCEYYQIEKNGNFEGNNILHFTRPLASIAKNYGLSTKKAEDKIEKAKQILLKERESRIRPGLDNKVLMDWNGMMITALWKIYEVTGDGKYLEAAVKALDYLIENYTEENGHVYHFDKNDQTKIDGYIDDYAYLIGALIDGFEITQKLHYLELAKRMSEYTLENFWDHHSGGFYFTHRNSDTIIVRLKQTFDASTPSGNNVMGLNLLRLHSYTGQEAFLKKAEQVFHTLKNEIESRGAALSKLVTALLWYHESPLEFTISLPASNTESKLLPEISRLYTPCRILVISKEELRNEIINPTLIKNRHFKDQEAVFICHKMTCSLPVIDADQFFEIINSLHLYIQ
jgi:uncharacterized protein YyaL (SSP411 family)